jgi:N-acetyl-1-D-myo-inositol-2-amino-2-deoxy-alpha-D-glucopyranoside deacetylase
MPTPAATRPERVLFVHAHPDDETLATGGTIATLLELGADVTVLTATRGERGEMLTPELAPLFGDGPRVAAHRQTEIAGSLAALGGPGHLWLGGPGARASDLPERWYTDSGMQWGSDGRAIAADDAPADSLTAADLSEVVDDIRAAIRTVGADAVVSYADDGGYGHPDHVRVHHAARFAAKSEDVPFSMVVDAEAGESDLEIDVLPVRGKVRAALEQYRSQLTVDPVDPADPTALSWVMPHGARIVAPAKEAFRHDDPPAVDAPQSFDEFTGAGKAVAVVIMLAAGLVLGGLGTITHQVAAGSFPLGAVLDLVVVAAALTGARLLLRSRLLVLLTALVTFGTTLYLAYGFGADTVLVPANAAGNAWVFGQALIAIIVIMWPDLGRIRAERERAAAASNGAPASESQQRPE